MIVSLGNKKAKYIVHFDHIKKTKRVKKFGEVVNIVTGMTTVTRIMRLKDRSLHAIGTFSVKKANSMTKAKRRTQSFMDALSSVGDRTERLKFVAEYKRVCNMTEKGSFRQAA